MSSNSYTGTVVLNEGATNVNGTITLGKPPQYDGLPDTPVEEIKWIPMTAFIEYFEDMKFSFGGKTWFCVSGSTRNEVEGQPIEWRYWAKAYPYIFGEWGTPLSKSQMKVAKDHLTLEEAQAAVIKAVRGEA